MTMPKDAYPKRISDGFELLRSASSNQSVKVTLNSSETLSINPSTCRKLPKIVAETSVWYCYICPNEFVVYVLSSRHHDIDTIINTSTNSL